MRWTTRRIRARFFGHLAFVALVVLCSSLLDPAKSYFMHGAGDQKSQAIERSLSSLRSICRDDVPPALLRECVSIALFLGNVSRKANKHDENLPELKLNSSLTFSNLIDRYDSDRAEIKIYIEKIQWRLQVVGMITLAIMLVSLFLCLRLQPSNPSLDAPFLPKRHL
jgi:hypothetical protein